NGGDLTVSSVSSTKYSFEIKYGSVKTTALGGTDFGIGLTSESVGTWVSLWNSSVASNSRTGPGGDNLTTNFAAGEIIDPLDFERTGSSYLSSGSNANNHFQLNDDGYFGFVFNDTSVDNQPHFGWARVTRITNGFILHEWAYETLANTPIAAGSLSSIPEPAADAALAGLGVLGLCWLRRKKR
ncbi:MAG: hypothetical protein ABW223_10785, partial [Rariglobus sp.]